MPERKLFCEECGKEIVNPVRKNQKYCRVIIANCCRNNGMRNYTRRKNQTKPENFRGRYLKK